MYKHGYFVVNRQVYPWEMENRMKIISTCGKC